MYKVGDAVYYSQKGVCRLFAIEKSPFDKLDTRDFYVLHPTAAFGEETVYLPTEVGDKKLRPLMSREAATELCESGMCLGVLDIPIEKKRKDVYREALLSGEPSALARLLNTVALRKEEAGRLRKHLPDMDSDFAHRASRFLYAEISAVLGEAPEVIAAGLWH